MKKVLVTTLLLTILLSFNYNTLASDLEIHGEFKTDLIIEEGERNIDKEYFKEPSKNSLSTGNSINLILEKGFAFEGNIYLDAKFSKKYDSEEIAEVNEGYLDYYTKNADFRIGKQHIKWGTGYKVKPNDVFNPVDQTGLKPFYDRLAVTAFKSNYYLPNRSEFAFVITPEPKFQKLRKDRIDEIFNLTAEQVGSQSYKQLIKDPQFLGLKNNLKQVGINITESTVQNWITPKIDMPENNLKNTQLGMRFTKRGVKGFDYSLALFRSRNKTFALDQEAFAEELPQEIGELGTKAQKYLVNGFNEKALDLVNNYEIPVKFIYPKATRVGFSTIGQIAGQNVWVDINYSIYDDKKYQNSGYYVLGHDLKFDNGLYITNQVTHIEGMRENDNGISSINWIAEYPILKKHELNISTVYDITNDGFYIEPEFVYQLNKSADFQIGFTYLGVENINDIMANFGQDRLYSRLKVNF